MKKITFYLLTVLSICFFSCTNKSDSDLNTRADSLQVALDKRNAEFLQLEGYLTVISTGLDSISMQESEIFNPDKESPILNHEMIKSKLASFKQTLKTQRETIAQLEKKLNNNNSYSKKLQRIIIALKAQLEEKESQIATLQNELNHKNVTINELGQRMGMLSQQATEQQEVIASQNKMLQTQDDIMNEGYILIASKKGLKELGILKRSKVDYSKIDRSQFKTIDIRLVTEMDINAKKPKILSQMPEDSYVIEKKPNKSSVLRILDPNKFWSVSKYLIIQED